MFYFAWQDDGLSAFGPAQYRFDEDVFGFKVTHAEGDFARLDLSIKNPRVGLLTPSRKQWAWLAWRKPDGSVLALFHGRLVGVPESLDEEIITLTFVARAADNDDQKAAVADALRVLPYFDPVFIDPSLVRDPDAVLEARSALWHFGRTDKSVTISDILAGEDGTLALAGAGIFNLQYSFAGEPLRSVSVTAEVDWKQSASGSVDIGAALAAAFASAGGTLISSYTGQGLEAKWLLKGDAIGGGWSVAATTLTLLSGNGVTPTFIDVPIVPLSVAGPPDYLPPDPASDTTNPQDRARFYLWVFRAALSVGYLAERDRSEVVSFTLHADVQDLLTQSDQPRTVALAFQSAQIGQQVDDANASDGTFSGEDLPIGDLSRASYFNLPRGKQSLKFLIAVARARLLLSARAANVSADIEFVDAAGLSCRMNAQISDARVPGGIALGKVTSYGFGLDGEKGELFGSVTIGCAIGRGNALVPPADGTPTHSESDYFGADAQVYDGAEILAVAGLVGGVKFADFQMPPVDDGVDFAQMIPARVVQSLEVVDGVTAQAAVLAGSQPDIAAAVDALNAVYTRVRLTLRPVTGGPFRADRAIEVSELVIPRYLDLEAT